MALVKKVRLQGCMLNECTRKKLFIVAQIFVHTNKTVEGEMHFVTSDTTIRAEYTVSTFRAD